MPGPLEVSTLELVPMSELVPGPGADSGPISVSMSRTTSKLVSTAESILAAMEGPALRLMTMSSISMTLD